MHPCLYLNNTEFLFSCNVFITQNFYSLAVSSSLCPYMGTSGSSKVIFLMYTLKSLFPQCTCTILSDTKWTPSQHSTFPAQSICSLILACCLHQDSNVIPDSSIIRKQQMFSLIIAVQSLQLCPTLHDPKDYSPLDPSVHGISQARILEWVAISFSRGSSQPRDQTCVSCTDMCVLYC